MARIPDIVYEELNPEQQRMYKVILGPRKVVGGPFTAWIWNPEMSEKIQDLSAMLRVQSNFDKRRLELLILVVARHWNSNYMWGIHEPYAVDAGLPQDVVDAIKNRHKPQFESEDDKIIYDVVSELMETNALSQASYDRALAALGLELLIELSTVTGFYIMCAVVLATFDIPALPGARRLS